MTNLDITTCYVGDSQAEKIYLGPDIVWQKQSPEPAYDEQYLTIHALDQASLRSNTAYSGGSVYYRTKGSGNWQTLSPGTTISMQANDAIELKGQSGAKALFSGATQSGHYEVYGNLMSLIYGDNFIGQTVIPSSLVDCFYATFRNCQSLVSIKNLVMPATTLSQGCYRSMFNKCWYLTELPDVFIPSGAILTSACCRYTFEQMAASASTPVDVPFGFLPTTNMAVTCYQSMFNKANISSAPVLPATTLADHSYYGMFQGCTNLTTAPALPATTLANSCYYFMFAGCTSLTTAPTELPATTLAEYCYCQMFASCGSLTTAPVLPANTLVNACYLGMLQGCFSLNYIKCLATDISARNCTYNWVSTVPATGGTFVKAASMTGWTRGVSGIPTGWTVQNYVQPNN